MGIAETQNLLNAEASPYSFREEWIKTSGLDTRHVLPLILGVVPIIPIVLSSLGLEICPQDGQSVLIML